LADRRVFIVANQPDSYGIDQCLANGDRCGASAAALTANRTISNPHPPIIASIRKKSPARSRHLPATSVRAARAR
jgi:hypothetical protein